MMIALPVVFESAIKSIRWPLDSSPPPLHYQPLERMREIRKKHPEQIRLPVRHPLVSKLPETVEELFSTDNTEQQQQRRHFGIISTALILLGHGLTDEAHSLVTPLSWPSDLPTNYGPTQCATASAAVKAFATYAHCLVHRQEADNIGELGMRGWDNADYWSSSVKRTATQELPQADWFRYVRKNANEYKGRDDRVTKWADRHLKEGSTHWNGSAVHNLCREAMKKPAGPYRDFAAAVSETELRVLLTHALQRAGYDVSVDDIVTQHGVVAEEQEL
jgi:hypothetical protein